MENISESTKIILEKVRKFEKIDFKNSEFDEVEHILVCSASGTGKSYLLFEIYSQIINNEIKVLPIFIRGKIIKESLKVTIKNIYEIDIQKLNEIKIVLIIDGMNEINQNIYWEVMTEIEEVLISNQNIQLILSNKENIKRETLAFIDNLKDYELDELNDEQLEIYLNENGVEYSETIKSNLLSKTPIFISLYVDTIKGVKIYKGIRNDNNYKNKNIIESSADLFNIWYKNFIESSPDLFNNWYKNIIESSADLFNIWIEVFIYKFGRSNQKENLIRYVINKILPYISYSYGYKFSYNEYKLSIKTIIKKNEEKLKESFDTEEIVEDLKKTKDTIKALIENRIIEVLGDNKYSFNHELWYFYFKSLYIVQDLKFWFGDILKDKNLVDFKGDFEPIIKNQILEKKVIDFVGEILEEYKNKPCVDYKKKSGYFL